MTDKIKKEKQDLEKELLNIINEFEEKNDVYIADIHLIHDLERNGLGLLTRKNTQQIFLEIKF